MRYLILIALLAVGCSTPPAKFLNGQWIQSKAGKKCGIVVDKFFFQYQANGWQYELHVPDSNSYKGFETHFIMEPEAEPCEEWKK